MPLHEHDLRGLSRAASESERAPGARVPLPARKWVARVLLPVGLLLALGSLFAWASAEALLPATRVSTQPVVVKSQSAAESAAKGSVVVQAPGWVEPDPFPIYVAALADGFVAEVLSLEGETVAAGQVVVRLVADDARIALDRARAVHAEAAAHVEAAQAQLREAQRNWDHPTELTRALQTAEARHAEVEAELQRWPAELERERAHAVFAKAEYERIRPLGDRGQASDIEVIEARQRYEAQAAEVTATERRGPVLNAQRDRLAAEVAAARERLDLRIADERALRNAEAQVARAEAERIAAEAALAEAALRMERMEITAPVAGVVMKRLVSKGSKVITMMDSPHSAHVLHLYDPQQLQVRVDVPLVDAAKVGVGQDAEVIVDVLPERVFAGRVTRVVHEADIQKNTLQVKVAIDAPSAEIKPEMLARARFLSMGIQSVDGETSTTALFVPKRALGARDGQQFVWLADQARRIARFTPVTQVATTADDWVQVTSGLQPSDRVIVDAPPSLRDGQRIRIEGS